MKHTHCLSAYSITVWISDNVGAVHLEQVWLEPIARFAGTGAADHQYVFVPGVFGILRAVGHGQALCFRENDVLRKIRVLKGCNILGRAP